MRTAVWTPLLLMTTAVAFAACRSSSYGAADSVEEAEGGAPDGAATDGATTEGGSLDAQPADGGVADGDVPLQCTPDAGCDMAACVDRCPMSGSVNGDLVRLEAVSDAGLTFRALTDCHSFACTVVFDDSNDAFNCASPTVGRIGRVCSTNTGGPCPSGSLLSLGVNNANNCGVELCTYSCQRIQ